MVSEKRLVRRLQQGDAKAFAELVDAYGGRVHHLVRRYVDNPSDAEDVTQEIFCDLHRCIGSFRGNSSLATWVYRVAHNIATSYVIRQRRAKSELLLSLEEIDSVPRPGDSVRDAHERMDIERLLRLIHQLKPPDREIMLLYLEDLDAAAIGEIMEMSAVNVRSKIHRIKTVLARGFDTGGEA